MMAVRCPSSQGEGAGVPLHSWKRTARRRLASLSSVLDNFFRSRCSIVSFGAPLCFAHVRGLCRLLLDFLFICCLLLSLWLVSCSSELCTLPVGGFVNSKSGSLSLLFQVLKSTSNLICECLSKYTHSDTNTLFSRRCSPLIRKMFFYLHEEEASRDANGVSREVVQVGRVQW
jgi:hypothetical protein